MTQGVTTGVHIAIITITVLTLALSVALLVVALRIQKEVQDKLDKAEDVIRVASTTLKKIPSTPKTHIDNKVKMTLEKR